MSRPAQIAPIAVFDAGIGSYALAERIHRRFPAQDVLYFADRASFPYGVKTYAELLNIIRTAILTMYRLSAAAVVIASNAPTIMVLDELRGTLPPPVLGVYPPIKRALAISQTGHVAVLGVASLVSSEQFRAYLWREAADKVDHVFSLNASALVELVESGLFLTDPERTAREVHQFIDSVLERMPEIDTLTLSSTPLPWSHKFFEGTFPALNFFGPGRRSCGTDRPFHNSGSRNHGVLGQ